MEYDAGYGSAVCRAQDQLAAMVLRQAVGLTGSHAPRVLDVACGTGYGLRLLGTDRRGTYTGVDLSPTMLRVASERHPRGDFRRGDMADLGSSVPSDPCFDLVTFWWCLSYAPDPPRTIAQAARRLRPGGALVAFGFYTTPDGGSWPWPDPRPAFLPLRTDHVARSMEDAGLTVIDSFYFGLLDALAAGYGDKAGVVLRVLAELTPRRWSRYGCVVGVKAE